MADVVILKAGGFHMQKPGHGQNGIADYVRPVCDAVLGVVALDQAHDLPDECKLMG